MSQKKYRGPSVVCAWMSPALVFQKVGNYAVHDPIFNMVF